MNKQFFIIIFLISINTYFAQKKYYVTKTGEGDFSSIREINNNMNLFKPGDQILFKRGEQFNDSKLKITANGLENNPIIFGAYGNGSKPIFYYKNYEPTSWIIIVSGKFITISNIEIIGSRWVKAYNNSDHFTIDNCFFHHYKQASQLEADSKYAENEPLLIKNSDYFILKNSKIMGNYNSRYQDMIMITDNCQYTIIDNNYIDGGSHVSLYFRGYFKGATDSKYNNGSPNHQIIKNNHFFNHSHHCLAIQRGSWATLIENNYFERSGTGIDSSKYYKRTYYHDGTIGSAIYFYGNGILRNNIIRKSGRQDGTGNKGVDGQARYISIRAEVFDQAIYNNTFYKNWAEGYKTGIYIKTGMPDNLKYENIAFVNNVFSENMDRNLQNDLFIYKSGTKKDFTGEYRNNSFGKPKIRYGAGTLKLISISDFNLNPPGNIIAKGNLQIVNPLFKNTQNIKSFTNKSGAFSNLSLTSSSPLIDAGDFLTYTVNSGSNTNKIKVKDAKFFIDGWGIVEGDEIQIGNEIAKITKVDYNNNILTVNKNISWSKNTGIALPYNGSKPDIGAVEYTGANNGRKEETDTTEIQTPTIIQQPENSNTIVGETIVFSVKATCNDTIGYQWWKTPFVSIEESKITDNSKYSGATTNTLIIKNIDESDNGAKYVCEIYNTKDHDNHWVNSQPAILNITSTKLNFSNTFSKIKIYLEGAFNDGNMSTTLVQKGYLPKNQPFNNSIYNFTSFQKVDIFPSTIVDWILVELRSDLTTKVKRFAALLNNDGNLLNVDGSNDFSNQKIPDGKYYLVIYHRNHIPIMSSSKISVNNSVIIYDFTTDIDKVYGSKSMIKLSNDKFAMFAGDADGNKTINKKDYDIIKSNIFSTGYLNGDIDMNGIINVLDYSKINQNIDIQSNIP